MHHDLHSFVPLWWFGVVQALGLVSAWFARVHQGTHRQGAFHAVFFLLLATVGVDHLAYGRDQPCRIARYRHDAGRDGAHDGVGFPRR